MNVFTDLHHGDLYFSLHLLFERRLGWNLYRPIGLDWFHQGFWKVAEPYGNAMDTVNQYLEINNHGWDQYKNLNGTHYVDDEIYHALDPGHHYYQKAITFEKFKSMKFDLIVPTIQSHDVPYERLRTLYQPQAQVVAQMGNLNQRTHLPYAIHTTPYHPRPGQQTVMYHQEIDPDLYHYEPPNPNSKCIFSMVNCLPYAQIYNQYKAALPEVDMRAYGASCPNGSLSGSAGVSAAMREANMGWHCKPGDGFGHTAMGWFASGRPVVTRMSDVVSYGADAPRLFEPDVTCINIEAGTLQDNVRKIRQWLEPENNLRLAETACQRFKEVVNYDEEARQLQLFFERIMP